MEDELYSPQCLVVWSMATKTAGFREDHVEVADQYSLGAQFIRKLASTSDKFWKTRFRPRDRVMYARHGIPTTASHPHIHHLRGHSRVRTEEDPMIDAEDIADRQDPLDPCSSGDDMGVDEE